MNELPLMRVLEFCFHSQNMDIAMLAFLLIQTLATGVILPGSQLVSGFCVKKDDMAHLTCRNGNIFTANAVSGTVNCTNAKGGCYGRTPSLLVDQLNCYWRSNCVINWPRDPIIILENGGTCIGSYPSSVLVNYKCIQPTQYHEDGRPSSLSKAGRKPGVLLADICSNVTKGSSMFSISGDVTRAGVIRSHPFFPWGYSTEHRNCSVRITWRKNQKLVITVPNTDLAEDDFLVVGNQNPINITNGTFELTNEELTFFNFSVGNESKGGEGFVLCFKFVPVGDKLDKDVCEAITTTGTVTVAGKQDINAAATTMPTTTVGPTTTELPKRCQKKKTEKARKKCAEKMARRKKGKKKRDKKKGDKKKGDKKRKKDKGKGKKAGTA